MNAPGRDPLAAARAAALAELAAAGPAVPWTTRARQLILTIGLITLVAGAAAVVINWPPSNLLAGRVPAIVVLGLAQVVGLLGALAPRRSRLLPVTWLLAGGGVLAALATRGTQGALTDSGLVCSVSHVAAGLLPMALVLRALRESAFDWKRTLTAGLALGVSAPLWGELVCERDLQHVLVHHLGALLLLALLVFFVSRRQERRSYAP